MTGHPSTARIKFARKQRIEQAERARREDGSPQGQDAKAACFTTAAPQARPKTASILKLF
ncbi:hypothetical protein PSA5_03940 [Pseudomonas syringae pv. actinidiae]|nr:hypothetical protein PSA5_03940 [Pseudomonas syringae pv. actinidiae]